MAKRSGIVPVPADIPIMKGMVARGDRNHDIAAWFGWNQGRVKEAKDGKYGQPPAATMGLPPSGAPGIKGRRLREAIDQTLQAKTLADAVTILKAAKAQYDTDE